MPFVAKIGNTVQTRAETNTVEWEVTDFFSLPEKMEDEYCSPVFSFLDAQFYLRLFPNGNTKRSSSDSVGLYLARKDTGSPKSVEFTLGIKGSVKPDEKKRACHDFSKEGDDWGFHSFCYRSDLKDRKATLLPNGVLTFTCEFINDDANVVQGDKNLGKCLLIALDSGEDSDVVITVRGKEFPAHRVILRARSPVFRCMFAHDTAERRSGAVTIDDCDPDAFRDFLVHVYSGGCDHLSPENVVGLYAAADKYDVGELRAACARFMAGNISVASFVEVVALAVRHDEEELIERATEFFCENSLEIVKRAEWKTFLVENVTVGNELIIKALSK